MHLYGRSQLALIIFSLVFILDQVSKWWIHNYIPPMSYSPMVYPYGGIGIFRDWLGIEFSINFLTNYGAAWGVLSDFQIYLLGLRIVLIVALAYYVLYMNIQPKWVLPIALILAGAIGNVMDFFTYGYVVDMFHFIFWGYDYPVFNIADSAVFIGVAWIGLTAWSPTAESPSSTN